MKKKVAVFIISIALIGAYTVLSHAAKKNGIHKTYYDSGELKYEATYKNGILEGITKEYNRDGSLKGKYMFKDGELFSKVGGEETKRDFGIFGIFVGFKFWIVVLVIGAGLWFLFAKFVFRNRPV